MNPPNSSTNPRSALIVAATGAIGGAVADELASRGVSLFLIAREPQALEERAGRLRALVPVHTQVLDALDEQGLARYCASLGAGGVQIDFLLNAIGPRVGAARYGTPSDALSLADFLRPIEVIAGSQFLSASRFRPLMRTDRSSVIVMLSASLGRSAIPLMAGITSACDAVQGLARVLAAETGPEGPRVVCARVDAIPSTRTIQETMAANARTMRLSVDEFAKTLPGQGAAPLTLEQVGRDITDIAFDADAWPTGSLVDIVGR
jgi:NAD(P)-dependent dehydrogenase (short-subunit alcohol dehydrogenase family)